MKGLKEIANDNTPSTADRTDALDQPFPNLRTREIVKTIVEGISDTCTHCNLSDKEQYQLALGVIRGARIVADHFEDQPTRVYLATLLNRLNNSGIAAISKLVESVTGSPLPVAA